MPTYIGFSTKEINQPQNLERPGVDGGMGNIVHAPKLQKKFRLVDEQLVIRDFLNAFNIKQGDKVGQPGYGTTIWNYVFDPNTSDLRDLVDQEVRRVASSDPRIVVNNVAVFTSNNGILIEVQMYVDPFNNAVQIGFLLNRADGTVQQV